MVRTHEENTMSLSRYFAPAVLAASLGFAAAAVPAPAQAQSTDMMMRVLVEAADVVLRGGQPYYRSGDYGYNDRLVVERDRYGNPVYYRQVPRQGNYGPPYGNAYGHPRNRVAPVTGGQRNVKCNKNGKCKVEYYDPRYDRDGRHANVRYDRYGRWWDGSRWRDR
jgi:hypothetical protein